MFNSYLLKTFIFIIIYFVTGKIGMELSSINTYASLVWPPTALSLTFLLIFGIRYWPAIFIAATTINIYFQAPLLAALGIGVGNTLEAIAAIFLLQKFNFDKNLSYLRDAILLILLGAVTAPLISSTIGVTSLLFLNAIDFEQYRHTWQTWWAGNFLANLIVTPLILSWHTFFNLKQKFKNKTEAIFVAIGLLLLLTFLFILGNKFLAHINLQFPFLIFPFVIWAALRFRQIGASTVTFLTALCALLGEGYFPQGGAIYIHTFLAVLAITGIVVASMTTERAKTKATLRNTLFELEKRGDQLDAILHGINDGITVIDQNDQYVYCNEIGAKNSGFQSAEEMMNVTATAVLNKFEIMDENGDPLPYEKLPHNLVLAGQKNPPEVIVRFRLKGEKEEKWSIIKASAIVNNKTKTRCAVCVFKDFTERKRLEDSIKKLAEDAKNANQIKSLFLANMSHEIRTPLGAILGFNALMQDPNITDSDRRKYSDIIARNGQQLTQLIDDILDLSKVEAGKLDVEILEVALPSLITDITALMNQKAKEKGLFLSVVSEGSMPSTIYTDPTRLRQILLNIIGNAIKFTTQGGVKVVIRTEPLNFENPNKIIMDIEDTGSGITRENQSRLFEWFTQADISTTRKFGGTGLGLALSRRLARALKGDVVLNKSSQEGTSFSLTIANQIHEYISKPHQPTEKYLSKKDLTNGELNGMRVLLAEDSADNRMLIECILSQRGAIIDSAENGIEAVNKALNENYDLVLMDIQMPLYDGLQATKELRDKGYSKPIVALTAHAMKEEREKTLSTGCNAHLTKPIEIKKLLNIVAELGQHHH